MLRKRSKAKHSKDAPKFIRTPVRISMDQRFRAGSDAFSMQSSRPECHCPTNISIISDSPSSVRFPGSIKPEFDRILSANGLSRIYAGTEGGDSKNLDHMSEEVVQVVEELMEQTCILKKRLVEMVTHYQKNFCRCQMVGGPCPISPGTTCCCRMIATGSAERADDRSRGGRSQRDSSGYESTSRADNESRSQPITCGYVDCYCPEQCICDGGHRNAQCHMPNNQRSHVNHSNHPHHSNHRKHQNHQNNTYSPVPSLLTPKDDGFLHAHDSEKANHLTVSKSHPPGEGHIGTQNTEVVDEEIPRRTGGSQHPHNPAQESPEELSRKLADAQSQIHELRCLVNNFVSCTCSRRPESKESAKKTSKHLLNKADSIQKMLKGLKQDCHGKNLHVPAECRERSGAEDVFFQGNEYLIAKSADTAQKQGTTEDEKIENPSEPTADQKTAEITKVKGKVDSSVREVNTVKKNDVVYSPEGRVIKTIETLQRTEIIEGKNPPSTDTTTQDIEHTVKPILIKPFAEKQGKTLTEKSKTLPRIDNPKHLPRKDNTAEEVKNERIISTTNQKRPSSFELNRPAERLVAGDQNGGLRVSHKRQRKRSTRRKNYSTESTESSTDDVRERIPLAKTPPRYVKQIRSPPRDDHKFNNDEEYIIREYIYPIDRQTKSTPPDPPDGWDRTRKVQHYQTMKDSQKISLVACKFNEKAPGLVNVGGKADSYFIEVQPKKSHSFNGVSAHRGFTDISTFAQRRASTMNIPATYKCSGRNFIFTNEPYRQEKKSSLQGTSKEQHNNRQYLCHHEQISYPKDDSAATTEAAGGLATHGQLKLTVKEANIQQIPYIIAQLVGNRTSKEYFISVLPEKQPSSSLRVNVVDKDTGNLLGYFFIEDRVFHEARTKGLFDRYLSLFVLNNIASYTDFVSKTALMVDMFATHSFT